MKTKDLIATDVIISGAGVAGLALAALLGRAGLRVALIDADRPPNQHEKPSGRTVALLRGSINVIKQTGVWKDLQESATPLRAMRIIDDSRSPAPPVRVEFKAGDIGYEEFGFNIPNAILRSALLKRIAGIPAVKHFNPACLQSYEVKGGSVVATLDNGQSLHAPLIVGTDGRSSAVRAIAGIDSFERDYEQTAMTFLIEHTKTHDFTSTEFHRAGGPFTFVPMSGNTSSVVWVEKNEDAKSFLSLKKQELERAVQDRSLGLLGTITLASPPQSWPLKYLSAKKLTHDRAVLAAEAAHVLSPIGAQGLNLSLRDVATLAETIVDAARLGEDIGSVSVLTRYARRRRADIGSHTTMVDGLNRVVANDLDFLKDLRRLGLKSLDTIPSLKNFITHQGLAPAIDEGRILKGQSL